MTTRPAGAGTVTSPSRRRAPNALPTIRSVDGSVTEASDPGDASIWLGSQHPVTKGHAKWLSGYDADLYALVEGEGRPLLVVARNSNASGRRGCLAAAADAHDVLIDLARVGGLDVTRCVPPMEELAEWLFLSPNKRRYVERSGRPFLMRSCLVDLSRHGIILSLTAGSSLKLDEDHQQPHVAWVQRVLHEIAKPPVTGMFTKRWDRLSRSTSMRVIHELKALEAVYGPTWSGDGEMGRLQLGEMAELVATARGLGARAEGLAIRKKAISGVRRLTDEHMVDGRAEYAHAGAAPPGLMRYRDRRTRRGVLALDTPSCYPDRKDAVGGLPDVRDDDGNLVDQVAVVRWFLANYGLAGVDDRDIVDQMIQRRYSTDGLRHRADQGPTAYWGGPTRPKAGSRPARWVKPLLERLDMYETGRLVLPLGSDDGEVITIDGIMPPGGSWASREDFVRIKEHLRRLSAIERSPGPSWSWSGFATTIDGASALLVPSRYASDDDFAWRLHRDPAASSPDELVSYTEEATRASSEPVPRTHQSIPDRVLTAAVIGGLVRANGRPMRKFLGDEAVRDQVADLIRERDHLAAEVAVAEKRLKTRMDLIMAVDDDGALTMPKALHARAYADWEQQREAAGRKERHLARLDRELRTLAGNSSGVPAAAMALMVNSLRDPALSPYRAELRRAVRDLRFWTEPVKDGPHSGTRLHFTGDLVLTTSTGPYAVPFEGSHVHGAAGRAHDRRLRALKRLRAGTVARGVNEGSTHRFTREVALLLGVDRLHFAVATCGDSALLRLSMATLFPDPALGEDPESVPHLQDLLADQDLIADFGDLPALVDRIREHHSSSKAPGWLSTRQGRYEVEFQLGDLTGMPEIVPLADRWRVDNFRSGLRLQRKNHFWAPGPRSQRPRPNPCRHCGGRLLASVRFPEATGLLCMAPDCRRDSRGVRWPARFDQYLCHVDLWSAAGVSLTLPEEFTGEARSMRGPAVEPVIQVQRRRRFEEVSVEERATIVDTYLNSPLTLREIRLKFAVNDAVVYGVLREAGLAPSRTRRRAPVRGA
jgi:hypothetical protein